MFELGRAAGLAQEPSGILLAGQTPRPGNLDRHHPVQLDVPRPEYKAIRARPEPFHQLESTQAVIARLGCEPGCRSAAVAGRSRHRNQLIGHRLGLGAIRPVQPTQLSEKGVGDSIECL